MSYNMTDASMALIQLLEEHGITYVRADHPAVYTCDEARAVAPDLPGAETKNLFLRDDKGDRYFLVAVRAEKGVDLKGLAPVLGVKRLSFASPERLMAVLGLEAGSVSLLGVVHDKAHRVSVILDDELWAAESIQCHPLVNTATLSISRQGLELFFELTGHVPKIVRVPARQ